MEEYLPDKETGIFAKVLSDLFENRKYEKIIEIVKDKLVEKQKKRYHPFDFMNLLTANEFNLHEVLHDCNDKLGNYFSAFKELEYQLEAIEVSGLKKIFPWNHIKLIEKRFDYLRKHVDIFSKNASDDEICKKLNKSLKQGNFEEIQNLSDITENASIKVVCLDHLLKNPKNDIKEYYNICNEGLNYSIENKRKHDAEYFALRTLE